MDAARKSAQALDLQDPLRQFRSEFLFPTQQSLKSDVLSVESSPPCTYLCGNSLGLPPKRTAERLQQFVQTWASQGVQGHFKLLRDSPLPTWLDADARAAEQLTPIVGAASVDEVAAMQTLTANLHLVLCAFYRPEKEGQQNQQKQRHKILLEQQAFPSDHFAIESQIKLHGLPPSSMITVPPNPDAILAAIEEHKDSIAVLVLPGIQYYTGEFFDIPAITKAAHKYGIFVVWDLAHAVGNVPLQLHDWDVDAAVWCSYKYLNAGAGGIGGLFVHSRHTSDATFSGGLAGWWGNDKKTRFAMDTSKPFAAVHSAAAFQLSNPSILDITSLCASLDVFAEAGGLAALRKKSLELTGFLEKLLLETLSEKTRSQFRILTPADPARRGAQLSLELADADADKLDAVLAVLENRGVVVDERKPRVVRVAPAPLYNTFEDCVDFAAAWEEALA